MNLELSKWNPFKFARKSSEASPANGNTPEWSWPFTAEPFRTMQQLMREPFSGLGAPDRWFGDYSPGMFQPRVDVVDDGAALRITAELPGLERNDVEVVVEDDALVLRGEKKLESKNEEKGCYHVERAFGSFQRVIPLPEGVDTNKAEAKFDKGVLTLRLPKNATEKSKARKIEIK
jgi:HSP20 family protein